MRRPQLQEPGKKTLDAEEMHGEEKKEKNFIEKGNHFEPPRNLGREKA